MAVPTDEELAASAIRGDARAMETLVTRFLKPVHAVCRRIVREPALAEDASQETFMAAFRKLESYRPDRRFAPWIFTIAARVSYNLIRTRQRSRRHEEEVPIPSVNDPASGPLEMRESLASLKAAMVDLPERDSVALYMRFKQDLTNDEIAEALNLPHGTVRVLLCRALAKLHARLDRELIQ